MVILILLVCLYFVYVYYKVKKKKREANLLQMERKNNSINSFEDSLKIKELENKIKELELKTTTKNIIHYKEHILNTKFENRNGLIGLSINRVSIGENGFVIFIVVYNVSNTPQNINITDAYYLSNEKEQIKTNYNPVLTSNICDNNTVINGFNVTRELHFLTHKKTLDFNDVIVVNFEINGYCFFLTESFDMIHNKEVSLI